MTARRVIALLAPCLAFCLLVSPSAKAQSGGTCATFASSERTIDCVQPFDDGTSCSIPCGGSYLDTFTSDNVFECRKEMGLGAPYQCGDFQVAGDFVLEQEWVFENVPPGIQSLVFKGQPNPGADDDFVFYFNINAPPTQDMVDPICPDPNHPSCTAKIDQGSFGEGDVTVQINPSPLDAGRYRIRVLDTNRTRINCTDLQQDQVYLDQIKIVTAWSEGQGVPDTLASSDYQTGPGTLLLSTSYYETLTSDNFREQIKETLVGGVSKLNHIWRFTNVESGCYRLIFEGLRTSNQESDNFQFSWAPDVGGVPGTFQDIPGALINQTFEATGGLSVPFTTSLTGTIYIRVRDTNQTSGSFRDTVKIDFLAIRAQ